MAVKKERKTCFKAMNRGPSSCGYELLSKIQNLISVDKGGFFMRSKGMETRGNTNHLKNEFVGIIPKLLKTKDTYKHQGFQCKPELIWF